MTAVGVDDATGAVVTCGADGACVVWDAGGDAEEEYVAAAECNDVVVEGPPRRSATLRHHRFPVLAALAIRLGGGQRGFVTLDASGCVGAASLSVRGDPGRGDPHRSAGSDPSAGSDRSGSAARAIGARCEMLLPWPWTRPTRAFGEDEDENGGTFALLWDEAFGALHVRFDGAGRDGAFLVASWDVVAGCLDRALEGDSARELFESLARTCARWDQGAPPRWEGGEGAAETLAMKKNPHPAARRAACEGTWTQPGAPYLVINASKTFADAEGGALQGRDARARRRAAEALRLAAAAAAAGGGFDVDDGEDGGEDGGEDDSASSRSDGGDATRARRDDRRENGSVRGRSTDFSSRSFLGGAAVLARAVVGAGGAVAIDAPVARARDPPGEGPSLAPDETAGSSSSRSGSGSGSASAEATRRALVVAVAEARLREMAAGGVVAEDSAAEDSRARPSRPPESVCLATLAEHWLSPAAGTRVAARALVASALLASARSRSRRGGEGEEDAARGLVDRFLAATSSSSEKGAHRRGTGADAQTTTLAAAACLFLSRSRGIPGGGGESGDECGARRVVASVARALAATALEGAASADAVPSATLAATLLAEGSEQSAPAGSFRSSAPSDPSPPLMNPRRFSFLVALDAPGRVLAARAAFALFECATDRPAETVAARQAASALLAALAEAAPRALAAALAERLREADGAVIEGGGGSRSESVFKGRRRSAGSKAPPHPGNPKAAGTTGTTGTTGMPSGMAGTAGTTGTTGMTSPTPQSPSPLSPLPPGASSSHSSSSSRVAHAATSAAFLALAQVAATAPARLAPIAHDLASLAALATKKPAQDPTRRAAAAAAAGAVALVRELADALPAVAYHKATNRVAVWAPAYASSSRDEDSSECSSSGVSSPSAGTVVASVFDLGGAGEERRVFLSDASAEALAAAGSSAAGFGAATDRVEAGLRDVGKSISDFFEGLGARARESGAFGGGGGGGGGGERKNQKEALREGGVGSSPRAGVPPPSPPRPPRGSAEEYAAAAAAAAMALEAERASRRSGGVAVGVALGSPPASPVAAAARRAGEAAKTLERLLEANGARPTAAAAASNSSRREGGAVPDSSSTSGVAVSDSSSASDPSELSDDAASESSARGARASSFSSAALAFDASGSRVAGYLDAWARVRVWNLPSTAWRQTSVAGSPVAPPRDAPRGSGSRVFSLQNPLPPALGFAQETVVAPGLSARANGGGGEGDVALEWSGAAAVALRAGGIAASFGVKDA